MSRCTEMLGVFLICVVTLSSLAGCVGPRDYFVTTLDSRGGGSYRDLVIPPGFFCPECEGFKGRLELVGTPINRAKTGAADSVLQRSADPIRSWDRIGKTRTVSLKLVELSLKSKAPITIRSPKGPQQWHVHVALSDKRPPTGKLTATKTHENGGTFDSSFWVQERLTFTSAENPNRILLLDTADFSEPFELKATATPFVMKRKPDLRVVATRRSNFTPTVAQIDPKSIPSQKLVTILHEADIAAHEAILVDEVQRPKLPPGTKPKPEPGPGPIG